MLLFFFNNVIIKKYINTGKDDMESLDDART